MIRSPNTPVDPDHWCEAMTWNGHPCSKHALQGERFCADHVVLLARERGPALPEKASEAPAREGGFVQERRAGEYFRVGNDPELLLGALAAMEVLPLVRDHPEQAERMVSAFQQQADAIAKAIEVRSRRTARPPS